MAGVQAGRLSIEIVAEIARLQADLDKAKRAVAAASGDIAKSAKFANDNLASMGKGITTAGVSSRQSAAGMKNLAFQVQDLGVQFTQAAASSHPLKMALMALVQQGPQIKDALAQTGKSIGGLVVGFAAAHPVILATTIAIGGAYLAFEDFRKGINAESKAELEAYAASLGMTAKEIEKAGGAAVTSGDMLLGLWDVFAKFTGVEKIFADLKGWIVDNIRSAVNDAKKNVSEIYAAFAAAVDGIKHVWKNLPAIIGEGVFAGVNLGISAIERLINSAIDGLNTIAKIANPMLALAKMAGVNTDIGHVSLGRASNPYAGAGASAADAFLGSYKSHLAKAEGAFDTFLGNWADAGVNRAKSRLKKADEDAADHAGKGAKDRAGKAGKEAGDAFTDAMIKALDKGWNDALGQSMKNIGAILEGNTNVDWNEMLRAANDNLDKLQKPLRDAADAQAEWNDRLSETVGWLKQIGGIGGTLAAVLGGLAGLTNGDFSAVGGRAGAMLQSISGMQWKDSSGTIHKFGEEMTNALKGVFGDGFGDKLLGVFEGAGMGLGIGSILGGGSKAGQIGGALGGAAGQALGSAFSSAFGKLASAAGPIGSIVGALAGSLLGGLLAKIPKASATIGVMNGELGVAGVTGNSSSRKAASTQGANSVIDALNKIADAFGASLGTAGVSIGMRKNSYVVDTTGSGKTKGVGTVNFGKDSEAALKAAIADAISDGVFVGLSAGVERLLKNGDVEKQLQKALSFQAVFDDLSAAKDPQGAANAAITKWHDSMAKIFAEAGATAEELAKLEELTGIKRADAAKAAAEALLEKERPYREAQITILQLEGKATEALAAQRQLELDGMEEGLRPLYRRIYALQDEAETLAKAAELASQRHELETQLLEILDPVAGALARQNDALNALDPSLRSLQQQIWSAKTAADAAAEALAEQQRIAKDIADERASLEATWLQLTGDTVTLRAKEREGISETNRALYDQIVAERDRQEAIAASTKAMQDAIDAVMTNLDKRRSLTIQLAELLDPVAAEAMRRADILRELEDPILRDIQRMIWDVGDGIEAAAKSAADLKEQTEAWQKTLDQRRSLTIQLADILDPAAAEAMRRADALNAISDPNNRDLQQRIYDAIDATNAAKQAEEELAKQRAFAEEQARAAAAAEEARLKRIADARSTLISAYDRETGALQGTIDKFRGFAESITAFREGLIGQNNPGAGYGRTQAQFRSTSAMAGLGSETALGRFNGDAQALLDAAKDRAGSGADYRRTLAMVMAGANSAIGASSGVANMAQQQLDTMKAQLEGLIDLNENVVSFTDALEAYRAVSAEQVPVIAETVSNGLEMVAAKIEAAAVTAQQAQQTAQVAQDTSALALVRIERLLQRVTSDDAFRVTSDETINVNVTNTTPVPVDTTP